MKLTEKSLRRGLFLSLLIGAISILLVLAFTKNDLDWESLERIRPSYFTLAMVLMVGAWLAKASKLNVLVSAMGGKIPLKRMLNIHLSSCFVSQVTPTTGGGLPLQVYMIYRQGVNFGHTVAASVVDSFLTILFYIVVAPILLLIWRRQLEVAPTSLTIFLFLILLVCGLLLYLLFKPEIVGRWTLSLGRTKLFRALDRKGRLDKLGRRVSQEVLRYKEALFLLGKQKRSALWWSVLLTFVYWGLYLAIAPVLLLGLNVEFNLVQTMIAQLILNFIQPFFPTPGASGGAELSFAYFFQGVVPRWSLGIYVMAWRLITYYFSLITGAISLVYAVHKGWLERNKFNTTWQAEEEGSLE
jgi:uncharacterized protein (TIRG00374 family)